MRLQANDVIRLPLKSFKQKQQSPLFSQLQQQHQDDLTASTYAALGSQTPVHSTNSRLVNLNPYVFPYGKLRVGKNLLRHDIDPWRAVNSSALTQQNNLQQEMQQLQAIKNQKNIKAPSTTSSSTQQRRSKSVAQPSQQSAFASKNNAAVLPSKYQQQQIKDNSRSAAHQIFVQESLVYKSIFFAKTKQPQLLKSVMIPANASAVQMAGPIPQTVFQIVAKLFSEIPLAIFNVVICRLEPTADIVVFFDEPSQIPFSKCCNSAIEVHLQESGVGMLMCNNEECPSRVLVQFLISFDDAAKIWKANPVFREASTKDSRMRATISSLVASGRYRQKSLRSEMTKTSREISSIFKFRSQQQQQQQQRPATTTNAAAGPSDSLHQLYGRRQKQKQYAADDEEEDLQDEVNDDDQEQQQSSSSQQVFLTTSFGGIHAHKKSRPYTTETTANRQRAVTPQEDEHIKREREKHIQSAKMRDQLAFTASQSESLVQNNCVFSKNFYSSFLAAPEESSSLLTTTTHLVGSGAFEARAISSHNQQQPQRLIQTADMNKSRPHYNNNISNNVQDNNNNNYN